MRTSELIECRIEALRRALRMSKGTRAWSTEKTYVGWIRRYLNFSVEQPLWTQIAPVEMARRFVESHIEQWSVATSHQFRNALVWYYKNVLLRPLGDLGEWSRAKRPKRLPVWLADADMMALISHLRGTPRLMAEVAYGSGARSEELVRLRWKDIDFETGTITVRGGKGGGDRVTLLAESVVEPMRWQMEECRRVWLDDRKRGRPGVEVPAARYDGTSWPWFWVWPAWNESRDPRTGIVRRHHVHNSTLGKAITAAVKRWGGNLRVTVHSLRHSFATALLMEGTPIQDVQALLGHTHIATTQIYAHVLPRLTLRVRSPMDRRVAAEKIIELPAAAIRQQRFYPVAG